MLAPGTVVDADPRTISNLIADQTLNNPAAISAALTYAGIEGAAQMTAISQIQAARAAIAQAVQTSNTTSGNIPALVTAQAAARRPPPRPAMQPPCPDGGGCRPGGARDGNEEKAAAQLVVERNLAAFNALLRRHSHRPAAGGATTQRSMPSISAQETLNAKSAAATALVTPAHAATAAADGRRRCG